MAFILALRYWALCGILGSFSMLNSLAFLRSVPALWMVAGAGVIGVLSFLRLFYGLIRWELRFDLRILEFGFHMFLLGAVSIIVVLAWMFRAYL
ncbi:MAG TPA: hypothetical protein PKE37_16925 [Thiomonas arsenitoxydans]|uniref:hypothetical protein n=1 Tax=Thiomonas arsenitoxydans (strain DSM 22701 / CIP 110005 / 3As) TaxID=426114 RepID=UPI002CD414C1|nr:hypothetical protein [Thiomonas arsenitoxydans]HML83436.1 hypothetical protein [Thiomonas arsenitoxydans]